jgi:tryptophan synthase beta chain
VGPEHAFYRDRGRIGFGYATDDEVLEAFKLCSRIEGIIPALESTHAIAFALKRARELGPDRVIVVNVSGRGDKDVQQVERMLKTKT